MMNTLTSSLSESNDVDLIGLVKQQQHVVAPRAILQKFIKAPLKGVHEYKDVLYMQRHVRTGDSACMLCGGLILCEGHYNGSIVEEAKLEAHVRSAIHETRYFQLAQAQKTKAVKSDRLDKSEVLRDRAKRLILPKWRWHVNDLIMQYIDTPLTPSSREVEHRLLEKAVEQLAKYEQMECLAVLELAIVKSMNSIEQQSGSDSSTRGTRTPGNETAVIIPLVLPFLGKPEFNSE